MRTYARLLAYTLRHKGALVASLLAAVAVGVLNTATVALGLPFFRVLLGEPTGAPSGLDRVSTTVIDALRGVAGDGKRELLLAFLALLVVVTAVKSVFRFLQDAWTAALTRRTVLDVAQAAFSRAMRQEIGFYEARGTPAVVSRFTTDVDFLSAGLGAVLSKLVREPLKAIGLVAVAMAVDVRLTLLTLALFPLVFVLVRAIAIRIRRRAGGVLESRGAMMSVAAEAIQGLRTVQAFRNEAAEEARFRAAADRLYREDRRMTRTDALTSPLLETLSVLGVALALWAGMGRIVALDAAQFLTLYGALFGTLDPLRKLGDIGNRIQVSGAAADRLFAILDRAPDVDDRLGAAPLPPRGGAVAFEDVSFAYPDRPGALERVSFAIEPGTTLAVVGRSGAGKSTLIDLVCRLRDPTSGRVLQDGVDLRQATLASVRARTAIVHQHPDLFAGTVADNVARGRLGATRAEIETAARRAHADEFVRAMPRGYDTPLGPGGTGLSGGQRQRLALARAILADPAILLLDEPTSALDRESEEALRAALADFLPGRTVFVIAHRPSTVERADRVLVLKEGRVEAFGSPEDVAASSATYRRLMAEGLPEATSSPA